MGAIDLDDATLATAVERAALVGMPAERWITLLIEAAASPLPEDGMDDMGFPSPVLRNGPNKQTHKSPQGV